eukprot:3450596-Amphidinium_carterae.1
MSSIAAGSWLLLIGSAGLLVWSLYHADELLSMPCFIKPCPESPSCLGLQSSIRLHSMLVAQAVGGAFNSSRTTCAAARLCRCPHVRACMLVIRGQLDGCSGIPCLVLCNSDSKVSPNGGRVLCDSALHVWHYRV